MKLTGETKRYIFFFNASDLSIITSVCGDQGGTRKMARGGKSGRAVSLRPPAVGIVCLVVHHQLVVHEVEAVRLCLVRVQDHLAH